MGTMGESYIPVINFKQCLTRTEKFMEDDLHRVGTNLASAFSKFGFAYLSNTGFSSSILEDVKTASKVFFLNDHNEKKRYLRNPKTNYGYVGLEVESLNPQRPGDYKEAFNVSGVCLSPSYDTNWPDDLSPNFSSAFKTYMEEARKLTNIVLHALSIGMGLKDEHFFEKCHALIHEEGNQTTCRTLYYPPVQSPVKPNQIRLGEHSDYGCITLLFQDDIGGLQVENLNGEFVDAKPIEDTVVANIGDVLQLWTKGKMKSTKHRVLIPEAQAQRNVVRQSLAYFVQPDDHVAINMPLTYKDPNLNVDSVGQTTDKPLTSLEYLYSRFAVTY